MNDRVTKYYKQEKEDVISEALCNKIRERLKLTKKELPDSKIKNLLYLNSELIGKWLIDNLDGFKIPDNGIIAVSKFMPKFLRGEKEEKIKEILSATHLDDRIKQLYAKRYQKSLNIDYNSKRPHQNFETFMYIYRIIWFNARNCGIDKARIYRFEAVKEIRNNLSKVLKEGKDYYEWQFSDFRETKKQKAAEKKLMDLRKKLKRQKK